ncbi:hypothetical protein AB3N62_12865 [Leptospira sp. WS4.C2]
MKKFAVSILDFVIHKSETLKLKLSTSRSQLDFEPLSPISNADIVDGYKQALDYALINSKDRAIQNIAITGPYGAGKTSTIKTYFHKYRPKGFKELTVSLATFKEEISKEQDDPNQNELLRKIELSILQQILYHVDGNKVPHSKFRGIQPISVGKKLRYSVFSSIFLLSIANLYFPDLLPYFYFNIPFINENQTFIDIGTTSFFTFGLGYLLYKAAGIFGKLSIDSFKFQDTEVKFNHSQSESYLNQNIDEILYFFKRTPYNVLIIEDLDRFQQTEIFTKLREINLLINSSNYVNKQVIFIYAIRDEIFREEIERTKFFDFIIPVIPIVNPSNSINIFKRKASQYNLKFSEDLLDSISLFVGDMRLLHNIINEFLIYKGKLSRKLMPDKLLAIIVFKNIFPGEYSKALQNDGVLHELVSQKFLLIEEEVKSKENEILRLEKLLADVDNHYIINIKDLRRVYLFEIIKKVLAPHPVHSNGQVVDLNQIIDSPDFESKLLSNLAVNLYQPYQQNLSLDGIDIVGKSINDKSYKERAELIQLKGEDEKRKIGNQIDLVKKSIEITRKASLKELISKEYISDICLSINDKKRSLVFALFKGGYIDESYYDYISIFHESENSITRLDYEYLLNLKSSVLTEFDFPIQRADLLVKKINASYFETDAILNFRLIEFLLENPTLHDARLSVKALLNSGKQKPIEFIFAYLEKTNSLKPFLNFVFSNWMNAWRIILQGETVFSDTQKRTLFKEILNLCDAQILQTLFDDAAFQAKVLDDPNFFDLFESNERINFFLENTKPTFKDLNFNPKYVNVYKEILKNDWLEINSEMFSTILKTYSKYEESDFHLKNYTLIQKSEISELIELVDDNIEEYVRNMYLGLGDSFEEDEEFLLKLCNQAELPQDLIRNVIEKSIMKVSDINKLETMEIKNMFFQGRKVEADWINIFNFSDEENKNLSIIYEYFNGCSEQEFREIIDTYDREEESVKLLIQLLVQKEISVTSFSFLAPLLDFEKNQIDFTSLSSEKISTLLSKNLLPFNVQNYSHLKSLEKEYHLILAQKYRDLFISSIADFELSISDLEKILKSTEWKIEEKQIILKKFGSGEIVSNQPALKTLVKILNTENGFVLNADLLFQVLVSPDISVQDTVVILEKYSDGFERDNVPAVLSSLGNEYSNLLSDGEIVVSYDEDMEILLKTLKKIKYITNFKIKKDKIEVYKS